MISTNPKDYRVVSSSKDKTDVVDDADKVVVRLRGDVRWDDTDAMIALICCTGDPNLCVELYAGPIPTEVVP